MLKKNLVKIEGYTPRYVQVRRLEEVSMTVKLRNTIKRHRDKVLDRLVENQSAMTMKTYTSVADYECHRTAGNEDVWSIIDLQLALGRKMLGYVSVQNQIRKALQGETVNEGNLLDYGTLLDLIYAGMETEGDIPVLTPLPPPKPMRTSRNRAVTAPALDETPAAAEATTRDVKRLFLALRRDIKTALESFSTLAGMESEGGEDEGSEGDAGNLTAAGHGRYGAGPEQDGGEGPEGPPMKKPRVDEHVAAPLVATSDDSPAVNIKKEPEEEMLPF